MAHEESRISYTFHSYTRDSTPKALWRIKAGKSIRCELALKSHANAEYTAERSEQTYRRVAARVTSTLPYIHLYMSKHSLKFLDASFGAAERRRGRRTEGGRGAYNTRNSPGLNPSGRVSWRGHVSLSEDSRREVCTHASNLMLMSVGVAGSPAARNNRRRHGFVAPTMAAAPRR